MNTKYTLIIFILLLSFTKSVYGQTQETLVIKGSVISETNEPLPFVNVLLNTSEGILIKATITDSEGNFVIKDLKLAKYLLEVSFVGYETIQTEVNIAKSTTVVAPIQMKVSTESLDQVTIVAEKPIIQVEPDKTIFNVAGTVGSAGNNGLEILRKAPGVRLDNNNNVIVEGKAGVLIYIDDRQSFLQGDDLTAFLQSLQADTIESIEIITQPSSKYDAAGAAGIINIKLKREKGLGTRGSISSTVTVGDFARTNNSVSVNTRLKKWTIFGSYSNYIGRSTGFINLYRTQGTKIFDAQNDSEYDGFSNNFRTGADYYVSKQSTLGTVISVNLRDSESRSNSRTPIIDRFTGVTDSILRSPSSSENNSINLSANLNYRYKDTLGKSFSVDLDYRRYSRERFNNQPNFYVTPTGEVLNAIITNQETPIDIDIYAAKVDYGQKLGKGTFETGFKVSQVVTDNTFNFFDVIGGNSNLNLDRSNQFNYDEKIYAVYSKYNFGFNNWKFQGGLRVEITDSQGNLTAENINQNQTVSRKYTDFFPSAGITYQAGANNSLALSYSRRIQRPDYQVLNPFEYQLDELSFSRGNPFLQPQYTDNFKLSHTYKYTLTTSISYSYVSDFFAQVTEAVGENRNFLSTRNVADQEVYNLSISYPFKVNNWWRAYANVYGSYNKYTATNPTFISTEQETFGFYAQNTFSLPKDIKLEVSGWYSSPSIWGGTYETKSLGSLNLAVQKSWKNWTGKITVNDVLYTIPWQGVTQFGDLMIDGRGGNDSRNINFYIRYSFGNSEVKEARNRDGSLEDEKNRIGG
ncbi:TonB-dependent receptor [Kordia sp. YSTF-M3]|uniref:TonB-dependent receptor n=1 Tax=Kordia aestuariivivens TaxID=2759037 RepID=A0ABR7Q4Q8_9FLAO|nr:outer membrane beta-barrel family protein [Kordia aestuariivivens]MBC8753502.1 TonB-dependent receptor [Kordia aestuariivivens]